MKELTLYDVDNAILELIEEAIESEDPNEFEQQLIELEMERQDIVVNLGLAVKNLDSFVTMVKEEIKRLQEKVRKAEAQKERIKQYLLYSLKGEKINTPNLTISYRRAKRLEVDEDFDLQELERNFPKLIRIKKELDKTKAKKLLESQPGIGIKGIKLAEHTHIQIK